MVSFDRESFASCAITTFSIVFTCFVKGKARFVKQERSTFYFMLNIFGTISLTQQFIADNPWKHV